jgi:hypothetical protein
MLLKKYWQSVTHESATSSPINVHQQWLFPHRYLVIDLTGIQSEVSILKSMVLYGGDG